LWAYFQPEPTLHYFKGFWRVVYRTLLTLLTVAKVFFRGERKSSFCGEEKRGIVFGKNLDFEWHGFLPPERD
jgi:hypothetical protein